MNTSSNSRIILQKKNFQEKLGKFRLQQPQKNVAVVEEYLNCDKAYLKKCLEEDNFKCLSDMMATFQNAIQFEDKKEKTLAEDSQRLRKENVMKENSLVKLKQEVKYLRVESSRLQTNILQLREKRIAAVNSMQQKQNDLPILNKDLNSKLPHSNEERPQTSNVLISEDFESTEEFGEHCEVSEPITKMNMNRHFSNRHSSLKKENSVTYERIEDIPRTQSYIGRPKSRNPKLKHPNSIYESICISNPIQKLHQQTEKIRERANSQRAQNSQDLIQNFKNREHYKVKVKESNLKEPSLQKANSLPNTEDAMLEVSGNLESKIEFNPEHSNAMRNIARRNHLARQFFLKK